MKKKTIIIDYKSGNLLSVKRAVEYLGYDAEISSDQKKILEADRIIMPGVGHFGFAMKKIEYLRSTILNFIEKERPFMGICLGMQLLYEKSEEDNFTQKGFEIFKGKVLKFSSENLAYIEIFDPLFLPSYSTIPQMLHIQPVERNADL